MTWLAVGVAAAASYLIRVAAFVAPGRRPPSARAEAALRDAGMGGLAALAVVAALGVAAVAPGAVVVGLVTAGGVVVVGGLTGRPVARCVLAGTAVVAASWLVAAVS
ncbi:MAG: hypothetical protein GX609_11615 [Actinomycetales bacterium]|jgi:hypothetical protein|nr:hypothetical protein [Actinomycetales bacterium]